MQPSPSIFFFSIRSWGISAIVQTFFFFAPPPSPQPCTTHFFLCRDNTPISRITASPPLLFYIFGHFFPLFPIESGSECTAENLNIEKKKEEEESATLYIYISSTIRNGSVSCPALSARGRRRHAFFFLPRFQLCQAGPPSSFLLGDVFWLTTVIKLQRFVYFSSGSTGRRRSGGGGGGNKPQKHK